MKTLIVTFLSFFQLSLFGQVDVTINWPLDSNVVFANFYNSKSSIIYVGIENHFRITIPNVKTRNIDLALDTSSIDFTVIWRPIDTEKEWYDSFAEYTLMTAEKFGAYKPDKKDISERYLDTNGIYWEKEYSITTNTAQELNITIYNHINDTSAILYNSIKLYSNHIPKPDLLISDINQLRVTKVLRPTSDSDLIDSEGWYVIKKFTFTAYDKKNKIIFTQTCLGNFITPEMYNSLLHKKLQYVMLTDIKSDKHIYKNLKILKN